MATYEFQCERCEAITEKIQPMSQKLPDSVLCRFCGAEATFKFSLPAVARSGMTPTKTPIDVSIGRDSAARWASIDSRQSNRDKVRRQTGQIGLAAQSYTEFRPITPKERLQRAKATSAVVRDGYKPED